MSEYKEKAKAYFRSKLSLGLLVFISSCVFLAAFQFTRMAFGLRDLALSVCPDYYIALILYVTVIKLASYIILFPLNMYSGFYIEHRFSFSNQTALAWLADEVKELILSYLVTMIMVLVFYWIAINAGRLWWAGCASLWILMSIIIANLFPILIIPLFYKGKAVAEGPLRERILALAKRMNIALLDVYEIELSRTTKKSNAALVGWGNTRRIILADNLLREFSDDEIETVVAHEMAHHKLGHVWKHLIVGAALGLLFFYMLSYLAPAISFQLGASVFYDIAMFPIMVLIFSLYEFALMPVVNTISRHMEREADIVALKVTRSKDAFISLMRKLSEKNLSYDEPGRFIEIVFYNHPPISRRITMARDLSI